MRAKIGNSRVLVSSGFTSFHCHGSARQLEAIEEWLAPGDAAKSRKGIWAGIDYTNLDFELTQ